MSWTSCATSTLLTPSRLLAAPQVVRRIGRDERSTCLMIPRPPAGFLFSFKQHAGHPTLHDYDGVIREAKGRSGGEDVSGKVAVVTVTVS